MSSALPGYSLCILHHGDVSYTRDCIASSFDLAPEPVERLVVRNEPGRPGDEFLDDRRDRIRIVDAGDNLGFTGGANLGIGAALETTGVDAVWLLNNDTQLERECPRELLAVLASDDSVAMAGPRIIQHDTSNIWHDGGDIEWPSARPRSPRSGEPVDDSSPREPFDVGFVCGCAPLIRGSAFREVGGFDDRYFIFYEDADLSFRLRAGGHRLVHVPAARIRHHGSAVTGDGTPFSRYYRLRNRLLFSSLHAPDAAAARSARNRLRRRSRIHGWKHIVTGRRAEGRAVLAALADARRNRWGRRPVPGESRS